MYFGRILFLGGCGRDLTCVLLLTDVPRGRRNSLPRGRSYAAYRERNTKQFGQVM